MKSQFLAMAMMAAMSESEINIKANAKLIADAGTTANICGKLPSQLLAEHNELLEMLKFCFNIISKPVVRNNYNSEHFDNYFKTEQLIKKLSDNETT